jgi:hypothetical protein
MQLTKESRFRIIKTSSGESETSQTSQIIAELCSFITHNEIHRSSLLWLALPGDDKQSPIIPLSLSKPPYRAALF